jgi:N-carbamoylputrescine amidase
MPLVAANRIGEESAPGGEPSIRFYGSSFIAAETGGLLTEASRDREEVVTATVDLDAVRYRREDWTYFRDRRPELYGSLLTLDGGG